MSDYIKLDGHFVDLMPGSVRVNDLSLRFQLGDGTVVDLPAPFVPINARLAITPAIETDGGSGLRFDFARWTPAQLRPTVARFPACFLGQSLAVQVAHDFDADPTVAWTSPQPEIREWLHRWGVDNGIPVTKQGG